MVEAAMADTCRNKNKRFNIGAGKANGAGAGAGAGDGDYTEDEECDVEVWDTLRYSFKKAQAVLDQNRELIKKVNENHQSKIPDNLVKNVGLIREINGNISKVNEIYSGLSVNLSDTVRQRKKIGNRKVLFLRVKLSSVLLQVICELNSDGTMFSHLSLILPLIYSADEYEVWDHSSKSQFTFVKDSSLRKKFGTRSQILANNILSLSSIVPFILTLSDPNDDDDDDGTYAIIMVHKFNAQLHPQLMDLTSCCQAPQLIHLQKQDLSLYNILGVNVVFIRLPLQTREFLKMEHSADDSQHAPPPPTVTSLPSSASSEVREEESNSGQRLLDRQHRQERRPQSSGGSSYRLNISIYDESRFDVSDDVWYCVIVLIAFWFFASITLMVGFYGSVSLQMSPHTSHLIRPNSFFVQSIEFEELDKQKPGLMVYGFHRPPPLDVEISWTETHDIFIPPNFHKEWLFFLNEGSQVNISYAIRSASSLPLSLVIAQGIESLAKWVEDPSYPNTSLSWNIIYGTGKIQQEIPKSSNYYVAVGNLNTKEVEIQLNFSVKALSYDTSQAYYTCSLGDHLCDLELYLLHPNVAVLSSPGRNEESPNNIWYVKVSYGPRWITYFVGSGVMTVLILIAFRLWKMKQRRSNVGEMGSQRAPLLAEKDDDIASRGSSYYSLSNDEDEEDPETCQQAATCLEGKPLNDGERSSNNPRHLCVVCFGSPRDCFFLPCGHCATCFTCGTRIAEEAGTCPICRRKMKKVRKVFTV
ncbi:hypothetical protein CXB51_013231 [Gossypium anomalum]|uniref:RING-type domain-containing protein n=1 Tax=Gossypium anomalum TaxID=47600 RepID=A0A8J5ZC33_9ROSI|nr:hypothetical protein CXB51_013231 [Gossypium anomalum]